jgi:ADP-ribose pyrophosphatase
MFDRPQEEPLLSARRFEVRRVTRSLPDGRLQSREVVRHPGSVVIVPCVDADHVCLIRNFRLSVHETLIELPAGTLESSEPPRECASRELIEETGYRAASMRQLTDFFAAPGILDEKMHLFLAEQLSGGDPEREPEEEIENLVVTWREAFAMVRSGEIHDAKTIVGLFVGWHTLQDSWPG